MEKNPFKWPLAVIAGILVWCTDLFFNLTAYLLWPTGDFSPLTNWYSDLGNSSTNTPLGAQVYNCGQVFQGLAIILFSGGLFVYYLGDKWKDGLLKVGQFGGFLLGFGLIMNGIISQDFEQAHQFWTRVLFLGIVLLEFLVNAALLKNPEFKKSIAYFGFIAGIINLLIIGGSTLSTFEPYFIEYIAIYTAEIWLGLVIINIFKNEVLSKE
jgi:hypothetical protein